MKFLLILQALQAMKDDGGLPGHGCHWCQGLLPQLPGPVAFPIAEKELVTLDP